MFLYKCLCCFRFLNNFIKENILLCTVNFQYIFGLLNRRAQSLSKAPDLKVDTFLTLKAKHPQL